MSVANDRRDAGLKQERSSLKSHNFLKENQEEESPKRTETSDASGAAVAQPLPYQQRALAEHDQLNDRQVLLGEFLKSSQFTSLVQTEQIYLYKQFNLQKQLLEVLALRIASFS